MPTPEIISSRALPFPVKTVYNAFSDPDLLKQWWGPDGFTNTIHEFDLRPGGRWLLTMHGPEKGHYENASTFTVVEPNTKVAWTRQSQPLFDMEIDFTENGPTQTTITFRMIFETEEACAKIRPFATPKNEENFDRLEALLRSQGNL